MKIDINKITDWINGISSWPVQFDQMQAKKAKPIFSYLCNQWDLLWLALSQLFWKGGKKGKNKKTNKHEITLSVDDDAFCHKISHIISKKNKLYFFLLHTHLFKLSKLSIK